jgi:hypothetical protein
MAPAQDISEMARMLLEYLRTAWGSRHREAAMKVIDSTVASNSPQELAIRFLLRHAQCQKTLTARIEMALWKLAVEAHTPQHAVSKREFRAADAARAAPSNGVVSEDSFLARFSQAYAAARHSPLPKRALEARSLRTGSTTAHHLSGPTSAAA